MQEASDSIQSTVAPDTVLSCWMQHVGGEDERQVRETGAKSE